MEKRVPLLAADTGYSAVKCAYLTEEGGLRTFKFPTVIAFLPFVEVGALGEKEPVSYRGGTFFVGEEAIGYSNYTLPTQTEEFTVLYAPLLLHHAFKKEGIRPESVCLSIAIHEFNKEIVFFDPLSGEEIKGKKQELLEQYARKFEVNGEEFTQEIVVLPQGVGIWFDVGKPDSCIIIDIGHRTVDVVVVADGKVEPFTTGFPDRGTITIVSLLRDYVANKYGLELSLLEAEKVLRTGTLKVRGEEKDLTEVIESLKPQYAMKTLIEVLHSPALRPLWEKHGNVIVAGGGAYFIPEGVKRQYGLKIPENPEYSNVRGFIKRLAGQG
jgi:hypothetical protein